MKAAETQGGQASIPSFHCGALRSAPRGILPRRLRGLPLCAALLAASLLGPGPAVIARAADAPAAAGAVPAAGEAKAAELAFDPFVDLEFIKATRSGTPVVLYFEADWCVPCKQMHAETFRAPAVLEAAAGIRFFRVDITFLDARVENIQKSFRVAGAPHLVVFGPDGKERTRRSGFTPPDVFAVMLGEAKKPAPST